MREVIDCQGSLNDDIKLRMWRVLTQSEPSFATASDALTPFLDGDKEKMMTISKTKRKHRGANNILRDLLDIRNRINGVAARDYMDRYIQLKMKALELEQRGLRVRMLLPDFPRRPMLVIKK